MEKKDCMRCFACGHGTDIKPEEPFIIIQSRTIGDDLFQQFFFEKDSKRVNVSLYACPKCGTVKIER